MGGGQERRAVRVLRRRATDGDDPGRRQPHAGGGCGDDEARLDNAGYLYGTRYIYLPQYLYSISLSTPTQKLWIVWFKEQSFSIRFFHLESKAL